MLIRREAGSKSLLSAWMLARSASMFTAAIMNLLIWNPALRKSGSLAKVSATHGTGQESLQLEAEPGHH
jgi:hypothetical protein